MTDQTTVQSARGTLAPALASRLRESRADLAKRWLERIAARVTLPPNHLFPTSELLDHVPLLIEQIADYLENPADDVDRRTPVLAEAIELGELRHRQGFDAYEILKEYELLGAILFHFLSEAASDLAPSADAGQLLVMSKNLYRALAVIQQTTMGQFLRRADERVAEREDRLRAFNRMISHEIKNDIGAILGAADLLSSVVKDDSERERFIAIVAKRARTMRTMINNLSVLSRLDGEKREHRHIQLPQAAAEAVRQLRDTAVAANIELRISPELPDVDVNAPVVELVLNNYLSNAIKYVRRDHGGMYAEISATESETGSGRELIVCVKDNGPGVPPDKRSRLFDRFFRANEGERVEGTGLGLSIVRETVESIGGRAWAEFGESGSAFCFALPMTTPSADTEPR